MRWPHRRPVGLLIALVLATAGCGGAGDSQPGTSTAATAFDLPRLDGPGHVRLSDFRGRPVVVNFFASWCTACRGELPGFADLARRVGDRVRFVGVDSYENGDGLGFVRQYGVAWAALARDVDGGEASGLHDNLFTSRAMPITAFYDARGRLLHVRPGALTEDALRQALARYAGVVA